jgi:hypothetical protein
VLRDEEIVADHPRSFRRDQVMCDPWHYLPVLMRKPGALRNGAPFKDWDLPEPLAAVRARLHRHPMATGSSSKTLGRVPEYSLSPVAEACSANRPG